MTAGIFKWSVESGHSEEWHGIHGYPGFFKLFENEWFLYFETSEELKAFLLQVEQTQEGGIFVSKDYGKRPVKGWWRRLFLGSEVWEREPCFTIYWYSDYATLSFEDRGYIYHAIDHPMYQPGDIPEEIRVRLNNDEPTPAPMEECLLKQRAFKAVHEFIDTGNRPSWLSYRKVG